MITSLSNPKCKAVVHMRQRAKARREEDAFIAEGVKMFLEAPVERIREVYVSESFSDMEMPQVREKLKLTGWERVSAQVFEKMSDTCTPQGILCVTEIRHYRLEELLEGENPMLLLLEDIQDPGNLGTMVRGGEGAGVTGIVLSKNTADIYNPKAIRSTMGSVYRVPFLYTQDMRQTIGVLQQKGLCIYAAHLGGKEIYDEQDYRGGCGFLIGNEAGGLKEETAACADVWIKIPMKGRVESLNAGMAACVLMFEAARQRRKEERKK